MPFTGTIPTLGALHTPTVAELAGITDPLKELTGTWNIYTPVLTGSTTNPNVSSATGGFIQVGHFIVFHASITLSSNGTGLYSVSLPVASAEPTGSPIGEATLFDLSSGSANRYLRSAWQNSNSSVALGAEDGTRVSNALPFIFAAGDIIALKGIYEGA